MRTRLVLIPTLALLSSCTSIVAQSRLYGPPQQPRELGCRLQMVSGPTSTPAFAIGEATCTPESEGDAEACRDQIRDRLCEMGADAIAPQATRSGGTLVAVGLKFGQGAGPGQQAWNAPRPPPSPPPQPPPLLGPPQGPGQTAPPGPVACNPPCPAGTTCSADGRRCESSAGPTATASLTDEQIAEALDRVRRRVLRCRRREDGDATVTVEVEIEPAGSISSVRIDGPIANSDAGACIEQAVFRATFPTFEGANRVVRHSFVPAP